MQKTASKTRFFMHLAGLSYGSLLLLCVLPVAVAVFEGLSTGLLLPLARCLVEHDFAAVTQSRFFVHVVRFFPRLQSLSNSALLIFIIGLLFFCVVFKNVFQYLASLQISRTVRRFSHKLRCTVFDRYLRFGKLYFDKNNQGSLNGVLLECTQFIAGKLGDIQEALTLFFILGVYLIILFAISWKLTLGALLIFPILNYSLDWLIQKIKKNSAYYWKSLDLLSRKTFNTLSCMTLVKSYANEKWESAQFAKLSQEVERMEFSMDRKQGLIFPMQEIILFSLTLVIAGAMATLLKYDKSTSISSFMVYFLILKRSSNNFTSLNKMKASLAGASGHVAAITAVMDDKDKFYVTEGTRDFEKLEKNIAIRDLTFSYPGGAPAIKNANFTIEKGKVTAIVGASGSGKTTLINLLLRFYQIPKGCILIDGIDVNDFTSRSLRSHVALVNQDTWLINDTLRTNLAYGLENVTEERLVEAVKKAHLYDFVMRLPNKFDTLVGDRGVNLSGGEKQRVSIARALLKGADILVLDEATSSLDAPTEALVQQSIELLIQGRTSIVIAHRFSTIKHADSIVVIENGVIVEQGALPELLAKKGRFAYYWDAQKFY